jgi:hypothetical protein
MNITHHKNGVITRLMDDKMNAYELAKEIDWLDDYYYVKEAANMLRQQADRIAELEKIVKNTIGQAFYEDDFHKAEATIARQIQTVDKFAEENAMLCNRIAELEKDLEGCEYFLNQEKQSEPVGYVYSVADEPIKNACIKVDLPNGTPLYTTPIKEEK